MLAATKGRDLFYRRGMRIFSFYEMNSLCRLSQYVAVNKRGRFLSYFESTGMLVLLVFVLFDFIGGHRHMVPFRESMSGLIAVSYGLGHQGGLEITRSHLECGSWIGRDRKWSVHCREFIPRAMISDYAETLRRFRTRPGGPLLSSGHPVHKESVRFELSSIHRTRDGPGTSTIAIA